MTEPFSKKLSILFILKKQKSYWNQNNPYSYHSSGLFNSADFINQMLIKNGLDSNLVEVNDGNDIDREVVKYNPDIIILEAIWCPPSKLKELVKLHHHKHRKWVVRNHSELPFLAQEGIALEWMLEYPNIHNVYISCNSPKANKSFQDLIENKHKVKLLTNFYPIHHRKNFSAANELNIGCFGAIRPLKNQLQQAVAAIIFAKKVNLPLKFHINASRIECNAEPILKSIRALFQNEPNAQLVEHSWLKRLDFLKLCSTMTLGLQVSYSETFNIVSADLVSQGVPVVGSDEIPWLSKLFQADPNSVGDIVSKIFYILDADENIHGIQLESLHRYSEESKELWLEQLKKLAQ
jgi:hypothetical protein